MPKYRVLSIAVKNAIPCQELKQAADEHHQDVRANVAEYEYTHRYDESGALKRLDVEMDFEQAAKEYGAVEHYHSDGAEFDFGQYSTAGACEQKEGPGNFENYFQKA